MVDDILDRFLRPLRRRPLTVAYPDGPPVLPPSVRGLPELDPARCDASATCVSACPTGAISLAAGGASWQLDAGQCVFCGDCQWACPREAIRLGERVELAARTREALVIVVPIGPSR